MGEEGQHTRFTVASGGARARAVAFRTSARSVKACGDERRDVAICLERNEWNGTVEPRLVLKALCEPAAGCFEVMDEALSMAAHAAVQLERSLDAWAPPLPGARDCSDRRGEGIAGVLGDLLVSGEDVLVVCADVARRRGGLDAVLGGLVRGRSALVSWELLASRPALAEGFAHVFALDPPPVRDPERLPGGLPGDGWAHVAWGEPEREFALAACRARADMRALVASVYRVVRDAGVIELDAFRSALPPGLSSVDCGVALRVLAELGLVGLDDDSAGLLDAEPTQLERSAAYRAHAEWIAAGEAVLGGAPAQIAA